MQQAVVQQQVAGAPRATFTRQRGDAARGLLRPIIGTSVVVAALFASARFWELPLFGLSVAFLAIAVFWDLRARRIPNLLNFLGLAVAIAFRFSLGRELGFTALQGSGLAFAVLVVPYLGGALGAGDVKMMMVLGALWGAPLLGHALPWVLVVGGVIAAGQLIRAGEFREMLLRWGTSIQLSLSGRKLVFLQAAEGSEARKGLPFAVCAALGASLLQVSKGLPW